MEHHAEFRFYEELNDFLPKQKRKIKFLYTFTGTPSIKDAIEAIGVPHTEVDLIVVNGKSKKFSYHLRNHDQVSVYPQFESFDIGKLTKVRKKPLRKPKFVLDVHLGRLAHDLRLLGFDTLYQNDMLDQEIATIAQTQHRTVLTRDMGLLKHKKINRGYWLRHTNSWQQLLEVLKRFDLRNLIKPFTRCLECNGKIKITSKNRIVKLLPEKTKDYYKKFYRCQQCKKIYWQGSHYKKLADKVAQLKT